MYPVDVPPNFSTVATVYDSLGSAHDLTLVFRKTATANQWSYRVLADASEVTGGTAALLERNTRVIERIEGKL